MKTTKTLFYNLILAALLCIMFSACNADKAEEGPTEREPILAQPADLIVQVEDVLDLSKHPVNEGDAELEFKACDDFVSVLRLRKLKRQAEEISIGAFTELKQIADNSVPAGAQYVTGLKITFGLKPLLAKMDLLYTPIYMHKLRDSLTASEKWGIYSVTDNPAYYTYNSASHLFEVTNDYDGIEKYRSNIKIDHNGNGFEDFNYDLTLEGDVRSVIFSFQEIDSVIAKNPGINSLKVFNASVKVPYNNDIIMKHSLLLGPDTKDPAAKPRIFYGGFNDKYANLGHLCPPGCATVRFQLKYVP